MSPTDKPLVWLHGEIKTPPFSDQARLEAGYLLRGLQRGQLIAMPHSRPMPAIGPQTVKLNKRTKLESKDWKIGSAEEFLGLSVEESAFIEMKLALSEKLKQQRRQKHITQSELAGLLRSSQSRVAKMEAGDPSVSIDLLVKSLLALGVTRKELGQSIS